MDPGFSSEEHEDRQERRHDRQVAVLENEIRHITNNLRQLQESLRLLEAGRSNATDGVRNDISQLSSRLEAQLRGLSTRLESLEQERTEIKHFKRRLLSYAAVLAGIVGAVWQVAQAVGTWLGPLFGKAP